MASFRNSEGILSPYEAEHLVSTLAQLPLSAVGTEAWASQHEAVERLNIQAHHNALSKHDEFVVDAFAASPQAVRAVVQQLLCVEAWRTEVLPLVLPELPASASVPAYMALYHEASLCNLLEVLLFRREVAEAADEALVELVDYCARKMNALNAGAFRGDGPSEAEAAEGEAPHVRDLRRQAREVGFATAACAVTILRFVTDHAPHCSVGVIGRMLDTNDSIMALAMLAQRPPWTRRAGDRLEKFVQQRWVEVQPADAERLTQLEGQVWLALYNLVMEPECRRRYRWLAHRKERVTDLRRLFTEPLLDQLPPLRDLQRAVEELAVMEPPAPTESAPCVIEQMPEMREALAAEAAGGGAAALARRALLGPFSDDPERRRRDMQRLAATYCLDNYDEVLDEPVCAAPGCGKPAAKRCSRCKSEWYCGRECQVRSWQKHKDLCAVLTRGREERDQRAAAASAPAAAASPEVLVRPARPAEGAPKEPEPRITLLDDNTKEGPAADAPRRVLIEEMD